jgi:hypothetical protein
MYSHGWIISDCDYCCHADSLINCVSECNDNEYVALQICMVVCSIDRLQGGSTLVIYSLTILKIVLPQSRI